MSPIRNDSPLDFLRNKSPRNPIRAIRELVGNMQSRLNNDLELDDAGEVVKSLGDAGPENTITRSDGFHKVMRLGRISTFSQLVALDDFIPAGSFIDDGIVEIVVTGVFRNNKGSSVTFVFYTNVDGTGVSSAENITITAGSSYRMWTYRVRLQQAAHLGDSIQCDEEFHIESPSTPGTMLSYSRNKITDMSSPIGEQMSVSVGFGCADTMTWVRYNTLTLQILTGTNEYLKGFFSQPVSSAGYDCSIRSNATTTNNGNSTTMAIGESSSDVGIRRGLIKFDKLANIPHNAVVDSCSIYMVIEGDDATSAPTYKVYRVLRDWVEGDGTAGSGATWDTYDGSNNWGTAGCSNTTTDYDGSVELCSTPLSASETVGQMWEFQMNTTEIQKLIDGTNPNYGFMIKAATESNNMYTWHTSDTGTPTFAPIIEVAYHLP